MIYKTRTTIAATKSIIRIEKVLIFYDNLTYQDIPDPHKFPNKKLLA